MSTELDCMRNAWLPSCFLQREPAKGFITRSESYLNASAASRWEVEERCGEDPQGKEPGTAGPVFDRSRFVQEVQLDGEGI